MKVFAITGLLGAGKTTASDHLKSLGYPVLDVDQISRLVVDKNTEMGREGFEKVYRAFGSTVLDRLGNLDRTLLRKRLMANPHEKELLEGIINPLVSEHIRKIMTTWKADGAALGFLEGARIFEGGQDKVVAAVIKVTASEAERVKRLVKRDSLGREEAALMVQMQDRGLMERLAKIEWKNDKALSALLKQIDAFVIEKRKEA